jgi:hypothetical protein
VSREGWSARLFVLRAKERVMAIPEVFPQRVPRLSVTPPAASAAPIDRDTAYDDSCTPSHPHWKWRQAALFLCVGAQLITISALFSSVPVAATWAALLLAVAPIPLATVVAFAPVRIAWMIAPVTAVVIVIGIAGTTMVVDWVFAPALAVLLVVTGLLRR